jgi:histidinol dehydrogenase
MSALNLRRIRCGEPGALDTLAQLRQKLGSQGNVVSPRSQALTQQVFGQPLTPTQVVERICAEVRSQGRDAVFHYTHAFDKVQLSSQTMRVSPQELIQAHNSADPDLLASVRRVQANVMAFQTKILQQPPGLLVEGQYELQMRLRPMRRVGVLVPGGAAAYPSTLLMTIVPARAAGVKELAVVMPPGPFGAGNQTLLAVCHELGVSEVYRFGGAQAVAALAYGIEGLPAVDMIVGPGNLFVALAKRHVFGDVAIDCIAGPSEIIVLADHTANAAFIAADLLAQAEHSPGASILVTWSPQLIEAVAGCLEQQLAKLSRAELTRDSLEQFGALVLARSPEEALQITNDFGPEHLEIITADDKGYLERIDNAGAIFVGPFSPVAVGDYAAGPSHVLPTGGTSRFTSGLSSYDFLRRSSVISFSDKGLASIGADVMRLARVESLTAHENSVAVRLTDEGGSQ